LLNLNWYKFIWFNSSLM